MRRIPAFLSLLVLTVRLAAQLPPEVDSVVRDQMSRRHLPGVVVAVSRGGVIQEEAYGLANVELEVPLSTKHLFPIASATKPFTSVLVLSFVHEGKLGLDDTIGKLLPDLPEAWREITVRQLLSHTSGLPDVSVRTGAAELISTQRDEALARLRTMPLQFPRGEQWMYNQTNYALLQMIVEKLSGTSIEKAMADRVFGPAGMTSATYGDSDTLVPGRVSLYLFEKETLAPRRLTFPQYLHTAAGINATAGDLLRFLAAADTLIAAPLRQQAWSPARRADGAPYKIDEDVINYGLGWVVSPESPKSVGHSGGGVAALAWYPDSGTGIVVLTNGRTNPDDLLQSVAAAVLKP